MCRMICEISGRIRCCSPSVTQDKPLLMRRSNSDIFSLYCSASWYTVGLGRSCLWSPIKMSCLHPSLIVVTMCDSRTSAASSTMTIRGRISCSMLRYLAAPVVVIPSTLASFMMALSSSRQRSLSRLAWRAYAISFSRTFSNNLALYLAIQQRYIRHFWCSGRSHRFSTCSSSSSVILLSL